jgi:hypothetical protein
MDAAKLLDRLSDDPRPRCRPAGRALDRLVDGDAALRQVDADEDGTFGDAGGAVSGWSTERQHAAPTTRSTASTTRRTPPRDVAGTAMMVSEPVGPEQVQEGLAGPG